MTNTLETRVGIFIAFIALAAVLILETLGGMGQFRRGLRVHALFNTVQELKVGDRVKLAGVEVGKVDEISISDSKVKVTMKLRRDANVRTDSIASIRFMGLLGQNFVYLTFGSPDSPRATDDTYLTTAEQPDLSAIMTRLDNVAAGVENLTKSFSGEEIGNLIGPFTDFIKQNSESLSVTISNIASVSQQIRKGEGTVGKLIYDDELNNAAVASLNDMQKLMDEVQLTINDARGLMDKVKQGQGTAGLLLTDDRLYNEATESMTNLKEVLIKINRGEGSVGQLVNEKEFYDNLKLTLQKVEKGVESLEDTGPLSVLGIAVGSLF